MHILSVSIVTYKNNRSVLSETINSVLNSNDIDFRLYIVDNSPTDELKDIVSDDRVEYIFNNNNIGFGAGHNIIMKDENKVGKYHLVLNPDISFGTYVLHDLVEYAESHSDVGNIIPKVYYTDGSLCPVCRLLPTPGDWIFRMFIPLKKWRQKVTQKFLMGFCDFTHTMNVPYLSGCFMFLRSEVFSKIGYFDERFFMYAEDTDLNRRIYEANYKTLYYPELSITHVGAEASHHNFKLLKIQMESCVYYLNKWGWFFDKNRGRINDETIRKYSINKCIYGDN